MKKLITAAVCLSLILCLCPVQALASGNLLDEWLAKLEALAQEDEYSEEAPAEQGAYSPRDLYEMSVPSVVEITTYNIYGEEVARGSGFFIDDNGMVVTNYHVIEDAYSADLQMSDGTTGEIRKVLGYDEQIDLVILSTSISGNPALKMSDREISTGDTVYTLGSSLGLTGTFSDGIVATANRTIDGVNYIQITAPISYGNSGGPLINIYGEAIGVNTMFMVQGQNVNFAVNIHELTKLDITKPLSLEDLYYQNGGTDNPQTGGLDGMDSDVEEWMSNADLFEVESNDSFDWGDLLRNSYFTGGAVENTEDFDYFGIRVIEGTTIDVIIVPYYNEDAQYLIAGLTDEEGNIICYAEQNEYEGTEMLSIYEEVETPGTYYVILCLPDNYPYSEPAYYLVNAIW